MQQLFTIKTTQPGWSTTANVEVCLHYKSTFSANDFLVIFGISGLVVTLTFDLSTPKSHQFIFVPDPNCT